MIIVAHFNPFEEIIINNINCKPNKVHLLLTDENGNISNTSSEFKTKFMPYHHIVNEESKYNTESIFADLTLYSSEELAKGVKTTMLTNFVQFENDECSNAKKIIEVILCINSY